MATTSTGSSADGLNRESCCEGADTYLTLPLDCSSTRLAVQECRCWMGLADFQVQIYMLCIFNLSNQLLCKVAGSFRLFQTTPVVALYRVNWSNIFRFSVCTFTFGSVSGIRRAAIVTTLGLIFVKQKGEFNTISIRLRRECTNINARWNRDQAAQCSHESRTGGGEGGEYRSKWYAANDQPISSPAMCKPWC